MFICFSFTPVTIKKNYVKSVPMRSFSGPYFPAFYLNMERYSVSLHIQSECGKKTDKKNSKYGHFSCSDSCSEKSHWNFKLCLISSRKVSWSHELVVPLQLVRDCWIKCISITCISTTGSLHSCLSGEIYQIWWRSFFNCSNNLQVCAFTIVLQTEQVRYLKSLILIPWMHRRWNGSQWEHLRRSSGDFW